MKPFLLVLLSIIVCHATHAQQSFQLTGTKTTLTLNILPDPAVITWNGDPKISNSLEWIQLLSDGGSQYYVLTNGRRTGLFTTHIPEADMARTFGQYKRFSDGRTFNLVSYGLVDLAGRWNINMTVKESDCPDNVNGQARSEIWRISYQPSHQVVVSVNDNDNKTVSKYTGEFDGIFLRLNATVSSLLTTKAKVGIIMKMNNTNSLTGTRNINRSDPCSVRYTLTATKL